MFSTLTAFVAGFKKLCGLIFKIRHYISREHLILYYNCYIKPIIQYGIIAYGCTCKTNLDTIYKIQNKILRAIYFLGYRDPVHDKYKKARILNVYELFVYELLKFVIKSVRNSLVDELNQVIRIRDEVYYETRSVVKRLTNPVVHRTNIMRNSLHYRANVLYNELRISDVLPLDIDFLSERQCEILQHNLQYEYILGSTSLISKVFG